MVYRMTGHPEPLLYVKWENNFNSSPGWKWEKFEHTLLNSVGVQGPWNHIASFLTFTHFLLFCSLCLINHFHMYFEFNECIRDCLFSIVITLQFKNTMQFLFFLLNREKERVLWVPASAMFGHLFYSRGFPREAECKILHSICNTW